MQASEAGYTESYIICPAAMVGPPTGPVPAGSVFFKFMTQVALAFKKAIYIGEGSNVFYTVSIPLESVLSAPLSLGSSSRHSFLVASGRPRRSLPACLCAHTEPRGCQGEPIFEVLHRRQYAPLMETHHDRVWRRPRSPRKAGRWYAAKCSHIGSSTPVRTR